MSVQPHSRPSCTTVNAQLTVVNRSASNTVAGRATKEAAMGLYAYRLAEAEISAMKEILVMLYTDEDTKDIIRTDFRGYVKKITGKPIGKFVLSRTINNPEGVGLQWQTLLYDYLYEKLFPVILRGEFSGHSDAAVVEKIKNFIQLGERRIPTPWGIAGLREFTRPVPKVYRPILRLPVECERGKCNPVLHRH
jgi:hypothetical protein